jgi:TPR repeat protein
MNKLAYSCLLGILLMSACEFPLAYKPGAQSLQTADGIMSSNGDVNLAKGEYLKALASPYQDVSGEAAHNLANIALQEVNNKSYRAYLEQAALAGHVQAQLALAKLYRATEGSAADAKIESLYKSLIHESASANMAMITLEQKRGDEIAAARYALNAEKILRNQIGADGDANGGKALMLGRLYSETPQYFSLKPDPEKFFRESIARGNARAAQHLAEYWLKSRARKNPESDAFALMLQSAEAGNDNAIRYVAEAYENGTGVTRNESKAIEWYEKIQGGINIGSRLLVAYAAMDKDPVKAMKQFQEAASAGSVEAMMMIDAINGTKIAYADTYKKTPPDSLFSVAKKNEKKFSKSHAVIVDRLYRIAADGGSGKAAFRVARNLESERAPSSEISQWYEKAANSGEPKAMLLIARQAVIGQGQPRDEKKAFQWYEKAAKAGNAEGQYETGLAYMRGIGTEKNFNKAEMWLKKAQQGGYDLAPNALNELGK